MEEIMVKKKGIEKNDVKLRVVVRGMQKEKKRKVKRWKKGVG